MRASDLREEITIQSGSSDDDLAGGVENVTWSTVETVRARIEIDSSSMSFDENQIRGNRRYQITIRYPKHYAITRSNRIVWGTVTMIPGVTLNEDVLKIWLTFEANELA